MSGFWKVCSFLCTQYLVGLPFAWITASMRRGMESISLWHCSSVMEAQVALIAAFRSSALLGLVSLIFLLTISHRFSMGFRSGEFAGQSSTVTQWSLNQLLVHLTVWAGAKSCWMAALTVKTQWANTSRWHGSPNDHWLWETSHWTSSNMDSVPLHSSSRLWDLDFQFTLIWKEDFGPLSNSPVLFSLAQVRCFWRCFSSLLVKLSQVFESALLDSILKLAFLCYLCTFT